MSCDPVMSDLGKYMADLDRERPIREPEYPCDSCTKPATACKNCQENTNQE